MLFLFYRFSSSGGFSWSFWPDTFACFSPSASWPSQTGSVHLDALFSRFQWQLRRCRCRHSIVPPSMPPGQWFLRERRPEDRWCRPALTCLEGVGRSRFSLSHWFTCRKPCPVVHGSSPYRHEIPKTLNFCHVHMCTQTYGHNARWPKSKSSNGVPTAGLSLIWPPLYVGKWPSPTSARTQTNAGDGQ